MKQFRKVSDNTVNRLPKYLRHIQEELNNGKDHISSAMLAEVVGSTSSQVRQDFSNFGNYGSQGYGYHLKSLDEAVRTIIGIHVPHHVAVIGTGCLGRALVEHLEFQKYNFQLCAAFDIDPSLIGSSINGVTIRHVSELSEYLETNEIHICILTVPKSAAKVVAQKLSGMGVPAIWNFTNETLNLNPQKTVVQNINLMDSLLSLTYHLEQLPNRQRDLPLPSDVE